MAKDNQKPELLISATIRGRTYKLVLPDPGFMTDESCLKWLENGLREEFQRQNTPKRKEKLHD